jgi:import receptor subunit TOM7
MELSPDAKERLGAVFDVAKTAFHWGFIPTVLYLGNIKEKCFWQ